MSRRRGRSLISRQHDKHQPSWGEDTDSQGDSDAGAMAAKEWVGWMDGWMEAVEGRGRRAQTRLFWRLSVVCVSLSLLSLPWSLCLSLPSFSASVPLSSPGNHTLLTKQQRRRRAASASHALVPGFPLDKHQVTEERNQDCGPIQSSVLLCALRLSGIKQLTAVETLNLRFGRIQCHIRWPGNAEERCSVFNCNNREKKTGCVWLRL